MKKIIISSYPDNELFLFNGLTTAKGSKDEILSGTKGGVFFIGDPVSGDAPLTVEFTDLSMLPDAIDNYIWDFGDGTILETTDSVVLHTYDGSGVYDVSLWVHTDGSLVELIGWWGNGDGLGSGEYFDSEPYEIEDYITVESNAITLPIFPYLPDWRGQISISYKFTTAISTTRRECEQRSSMYFKPRRLISCMFTLRKNQASKLWNFLVRIRSTVFLFPIISEPIISTEKDSVEFTSPDLYPLNALTDYHNINRVDVSAAEHSAVLLYDLRDSILPEGAIITDIITRALPANPDGAKIETNGWTGAFTRGHTNIYPGVPVMLTSKQKKNITDSTCQILITVDEIPGYDVT